MLIRLARLGALVGCLLVLAQTGCICGQSPALNLHPVITAPVVPATTAVETSTAAYMPRPVIATSGATTDPIVCIITAPSDEIARAAADDLFHQTDAKLTRAWKSLIAESESGVPSFSGSSWLDEDVCPLGPLRLGPVLARTEWSNIYLADIMNATTDQPERRVVVKHMNDCGSRLDRRVRHTRHPLVSDATFLSALASTGLVPAPIYLSPASPIPPSGILCERVHSKSMDEDRPECAEAGTQTRFLVQKEAGASLGRYLKQLYTAPWPVMAHRAVTLIIRVIQMLRTIHDLGIIHGDIHGGNILFQRPDYIMPSMDDTDLVFIDFEYAVFYPSELGTSTRAAKRSRLNRILMSPWHLWGYRLGRRDDVFRALELLANTLSTGDYHLELEDKVDDLNYYDGETPDHQYGNLKKPTTLFHEVIPQLYSADPGNTVRRQLDHIADAHLGALGHPDSRPDYDAIIAHLSVVQELLSSHG